MRTNKIVEYLNDILETRSLDPSSAITDDGRKIVNLRRSAIKSAIKVIKNNELIECDLFALDYSKNTIEIKVTEEILNQKISSGKLKVDFSGIFK